MKVFMDTVGCRLNQAEIELLARQFRAAGHTIVAAASQADLVIINTCTVTGQAAADSRAAVRRANRNGAGKIVVTGCWATLDPTAAVMPGVVRTVPNLEKDRLAVDLLDLPIDVVEDYKVDRQALPGSHSRTRAFIKVQDGCDNACTFCITTVARGALRSRSVDAIQRDIQAAVDGGAKEIVLTGVHLGAWGRDLDPSRHLTDLVCHLLVSTDIQRLRLSSLEPWDINRSFLKLWENHVLCRHLHLPLQSGSREVLKRMCRNTTPERYSSLLDLVRDSIPDVAITTDIMVAFPGETEAEFNETLEFVRKMDFSGGHIFRYSPRQGTLAAAMPDQVEDQHARRRSAQLRTILEESTNTYRGKFVGEEVFVLWEARKRRSTSGWILTGLTDNYLHVSAESPEWKPNQFDRVRIKGINSSGLVGDIC